MNLAAKYRPKTLEEVTEQPLVVDILKNMCKDEKLETRNFLLVGPAGTGKTTSARACANMLNNDVGDPIEIDAASHSGVEDMRQIVSQAQQYPIGTKWKIFIIDECFHKDSLVATPNGDKRIQDIKSGDYVYGLDGKHKVLQTFENMVPNSNLLLVHTNHGSILTTKCHLFMTSEGWIEGQHLMKGDQLYAKRDDQMCDMWERVPSSGVGSPEGLREGLRRDSTEETSGRISSELSENWLHKTVSDMWKRILYSKERQFENLLNEVWKVIQSAAGNIDSFTSEFFRSQVLIYLSDMWKAESNIQIGASEVLFNSVCRSSSESEEKFSTSSVNSVLHYMWQRVQSEMGDDSDLLKSLQEHIHKSEAERAEVSGIVYQNETQQSNEKSKSYSKDVSYKEIEWDIASALCTAWRQRILHPASALAVSEFEFEMGIRVSCDDTCKAKLQSGALCVQLQSRPRTTRYSTSDRGGWSRPQYEIAQIARSEENNVFGRSWVESIEVYQPGHNDESFSSYFTGEELRSGYVCLYDLEVEGHPSYFVNDVLVHNCHSLSNQSWQAALKMLEEQPAKSIFFFCTTNPEKIPPTILSRVQKFQLSKISLSGIESRLKYIIECENKEGRNITFTEDAIQMIAKLANGGMRDAITLMDKALAYSEDLSIQNLEKSLDMPNYDDYFDFLNALAKKDNTKIIDIINTVYNSGTNYVKWMENFHSFICNIIKYIFLQDITKTMIPSTYQEKISKYSTQHAILCLRLANKLVKLNQELKSTQYLQEYTISELCEIPAQ